MLGTAFFCDSGISYKAYKDGRDPEQEEVRNGLWVRAIEEMPMLVGRKQRKVQQEEGLPLLKVRQKTTVSHLVLSRQTTPASDMKTIRHDTGPVSLRTYLALIVTEITGITAAVEQRSSRLRIQAMDSKSLKATNHASCNSSGITVIQSGLAAERSSRSASSLHWDLSSQSAFYARWCGCLSAFNICGLATSCTLPSLCISTDMQEGIIGPLRRN